MIVWVLVERFGRLDIGYHICKPCGDEPSVSLYPSLRYYSLPKCLLILCSKRNPRLKPCVDWKLRRYRSDGRLGMDPWNLFGQLPECNYHVC
jgi:hypothetical protein